MYSYKIWLLGGRPVVLLRWIQSLLRAWFVWRRVVSVSLCCRVFYRWPMSRVAKANQSNQIIQSINKGPVRLMRCGRPVNRRVGVCSFGSGVVRSGKVFCRRCGLRSRWGLGRGLKVTLARGLKVALARGRGLRSLSVFGWPLRCYCGESSLELTVTGIPRWSRPPVLCSQEPQCQTEIW